MSNTITFDNLATKTDIAQLKADLEKIIEKTRANLIVSTIVIAGVFSATIIGILNQKVLALNIALLTAGLIAGLGGLAMLYVARAQDRRARQSDDDA